MRIRIKVPTKKKLILYISALCIVGVFLAFTLFEKEKDLYIIHEENGNLYRYVEDRKNQ